MAKRIYIAGHRGMVGSALVRQLAQDEGNEIITRELTELDLCNQQQVRDFFASESNGGTQPAFDEVYLAAAKVGGIHANDTYPAEFIYENLAIECNVVHEAWRSGVTRLLLLGSSCIYPRLAEQPMQESALLGGHLEPTNEPYAIAKIAGIKLCESYNRQYGVDYRSVMPTNLFGPGDNYHPENSHVVPALLRRFHEAKICGADSVTIWGTGEPRREFLHVADMARACLHVMNLPVEQYRSVTEPRLSHINVGTGKDCSIGELAMLIREITGFEGRVEFDHDKPDGSPRKLMDSSKLMNLGWKPQFSLKEGLADAYRWFVEHHETQANQG